LKQKTVPRDQRTGYFTSVDWWSLGVVMYECLVGKVKDYASTSLKVMVLMTDTFLKRPFSGKNSDDLSAHIMNNELHFPPESLQNLSPECVDAVTRVLLFSFSPFSYHLFFFFFFHFIFVGSFWIRILTLVLVAVKMACRISKTTLSSNLLTGRKWKGKKANRRSFPMYLFQTTLFRSFS